MIARNAHELMRALEVASILDCADMAAFASLFRTESRWGLYHLRVDYPAKDDANWFCHTHASQERRPHGLREARGRSLRRSDRRRGEGRSTTSSASARSAEACRCTRTAITENRYHAARHHLHHASRSSSTTTKCIADKGCTVCVDVCPLDVLRISDVTGKAYMEFDECWYCMPCEDDCPTGAVTVNIPYLLK